MDYPEAMAALQELVGHRVLAACFEPDGTPTDPMEGEFAIGGTDPSEFGAEHLPEHQFDIVVSDRDKDPFALMLWRLTETEHSDGEWLEQEGRRVLELRCTDGTAARFKLLD